VTVTVVMLVAFLVTPWGAVQPQKAILIKGLELCRVTAGALQELHGEKSRFYCIDTHQPVREERES